MSAEMNPKVRESFIDISLSTFSYEVMQYDGGAEGYGVSVPERRPKATIGSHTEQLNRFRTERVMKIDVVYSLDDDNQKEKQVEIDISGVDLWNDGLYDRSVNTPPRESRG